MEAGFGQGRGRGKIFFRFKGAKTYTIESRFDGMSVSTAGLEIPEST